MINVHTQGIAKGAANPHQYVEAGYLAGQRMIRLVVTILLIILICIIIWKIWKAVNAGAGAAGTIIEQQIVQSQTGVSPTRQTEIKGIADAAHKAIWGDKRSKLNPFGWFGESFDAWTEDEEAFISAVNRLQTVNEVSLFNDYYRQIGGKSARSDMNEYLDSSDIAEIKLLVSQNLN